VFAPAGLPAAEAALLRRQVVAVATSTAYSEKLGNLGVTPSQPPSDLDAFLRGEVAKWGKAVRDANIHID
jgi:tripartite-type tricarboxylate transporter receptor subunit TctC